mgnify:CR=1 FL=1|tara:strand:- start:5426 stop:5674 length:249 start_codon:yes stop_codon:yes gene_type:complete
MEDPAITAGFVALAMALVKMCEKIFQRTNGGSVEFRLSALEKQIASMQQSIRELSKDFFEFREMARIKWAKDEADEERKNHQ